MKRKKLDLVRDLAFIAITLAGREPRRPTLSDEELHTLEAEVGIDLDPPIPPPTPPPPPPRPRKEFFKPPILQKRELESLLFYGASAISSSSISEWVGVPTGHHGSIRLRKIGEG